MEDQALRQRGLAAALVAAVVLAGCGGGGNAEKEKPARAPGASAPSGQELLATTASRLERALPARDCRVLGRLMLHSAPRAAEPDTPPTAEECKRIRTDAGNELAGFRAVRSVAYGSGGFTEGSGHNRRAGEVVGVIWARDRDGSWKAVYDAIFRKQLGVAPAYGQTADRNAGLFVRAVAGGDCDGMWRYLNVGSRFVGGNRGDRSAFCRAITPQYKDAASAFAQIKADPGARPRSLGATRDIAFYGLRLRNGREMLIVLSGRLGGTVDIHEQTQHDNPSVLEFVTVRRPAE
ncbi:MAG: hypothetical protein QOJ14_1811 [Thermoleophilaceae bacterium]|nr:hypothetical protein [Thermoleophilaceae bacterium]